MAAGQDLLDLAIGALELPGPPHTFEYDDNGNRLVAREPGMPYLGVPAHCA